MRQGWGSCLRRALDQEGQMHAVDIDGWSSIINRSGVSGLIHHSINYCWEDTGGRTFLFISWTHSWKFRLALALQKFPTKLAARGDTRLFDLRSTSDHSWTKLFWFFFSIPKFEHVLSLVSMYLETINLIFEVDIDLITQSALKWGNFEPRSLPNLNLSLFAMTLWDHTSSP